jgi:hypothetical protein
MGIILSKHASPLIGIYIFDRYSTHLIYLKDIEKTVTRIPVFRATNPILGAYLVCISDDCLGRQWFRFFDHVQLDFGLIDCRR